MKSDPGRDSRHSRLPQAMTLALVVLSVFAAIVVSHMAGKWDRQRDDAFITFTFARTLAQGNGFAFNAGEPVLATTTPLWTMILALGSALLSAVAGTPEPVPIPLLAILIGGVMWIGAGWILFRFMQGVGAHPLIATAASSAIILQAAFLHSFLGMEQPLFTLLLVLSTVWIYHNRQVLAGMCIVALFLTRGEGVLLLPLAVLQLWHATRSFPWRLLAGFAALMLPWITYAQINFGSPFPSTLAAKMAQTLMLDSIRERWIGHLQGQFVNRLSLPDLRSISPLLTAAWLAIPGMIAVIVDKTLRPLWLMVACPLSGLAGYLVLNVAGYHWYTIQTAIAALLLTMVGTAWLCLRLFTAARFRSGWTAGGIRLFALIIGIPLIVPLAVNASPLLTGVRLGSEQRSDTYRAIAAWLKKASKPGDSVAFAEVGYLGYFSGLRVVDFAGLITPDAISHFGRQDLGEWLVARERPTFVVEWTPFTWLTGPMTTSESFLREYKPATTIPSRMNNATPFVIWRRIE